MDWKTQHGDPGNLDRVILRTTVGSQVHGMAIGGTDDHDEIAVFVQSERDLLGVTDPHEFLILRTANEGARSYHGDTDLSAYSLRKFLTLAMKGNPSILLPLFTPDEFVHEQHWLGSELRDLAPKFATLDAGKRFYGYLESQRLRMLGEDKQNRVPKRPELIEAYGYDTKYASHALRLAYEGIEFLTERKLTLPMAPNRLSYCLAVKKGEVSFGQALAWIGDARDELDRLLDTPPAGLPEHADVEALSAWSVRAHRAYWDEEARVRPQAGS